jgi:excisionase family DNA binding protein
MPAETPDYLSRQNVAARLDCSVSTVRRLVESGRLDEVRLTPDCPRIPAVSFDQLVKSLAPPAQDGGG